MTKLYKKVWIWDKHWFDLHNINRQIRLMAFPYKKYNLLVEFHVPCWIDIHCKVCKEKIFYPTYIIKELGSKYTIKALIKHYKTNHPFEYSIWKHKRNKYGNV